MGDLGGRVDPSKGPESRDATGGSDDYLGCGRDDLEVCVELGGGGVCRHFVRGSSLGDLSERAHSLVLSALVIMVWEWGRPPREED